MYFITNINTSFYDCHKRSSCNSISHIQIRQYSKAEKAGLQLEDVILCVNGVNCEGLSHVAVTSLTDISDVLNMLVLR